MLLQVYEVQAFDVLLKSLVDLSGNRLECSQLGIYEMTGPETQIIIALEHRWGDIEKWFFQDISKHFTCEKTDSKTHNAFYSHPKIDIYILRKKDIWQHSGKKCNKLWDTSRWWLSVYWGSIFVCKLLMSRPNVKIEKFYCLKSYLRFAGFFSCSYSSFFLCSSILHIFSDIHIFPSLKQISLPYIINK